MTKTYIIKFQTIPSYHEGGTMRVKNCMSELHAKSKLEDYLKKKYNITKLIVLDCKPDLPGAFSMFNDIFK